MPRTHDPLDLAVFIGDIAADSLAQNETKEEYLDRLVAALVTVREVQDPVKRLIAAVKRLARGCSCDYDYRCTNCQRILDAIAIASEIEP